jgi:hypothetical protein
MVATAAAATMTSGMGRRHGNRTKGGNAQAYRDYHVRHFGLPDAGPVKIASLDWAGRKSRNLTYQPTTTVIEIPVSYAGDHESSAIWTNSRGSLIEAAARSSPCLHPDTDMRLPRTHSFRLSYAQCSKACR